MLYSKFSPPSLNSKISSHHVVTPSSHESVLFVFTLDSKRRWAVYLSHLCSGGSMKKEPVGVFPRREYHFPSGAVKTRAALTSLSLNLSAGTMTLYLGFCAQILSYRDEWREGARESRDWNREVEIEIEGEGQLHWENCQEWIWEILHKAFLLYSAPS